MAELNRAIAELLFKLNNRPFKKLPGSRFSSLKEIDRPALLPRSGRTEINNIPIGKLDLEIRLTDDFEPPLGSDRDTATIVVITDRNDLDDQLYGTFSGNKDLLRQEPVQAESRANLRELLSVVSGGVVFSTIQKFFPEEKGDTYQELSPRRNIVVIADEAHRSQYDFIDGFARHMHDALPNASFIGFTGTPIESVDKNTPAVFGDYIDKYDILRAVEDGATVRIYYESRLAKIELDEAEKPTIDPKFEEKR